MTARRVAGGGACAPEAAPRAPPALVPGSLNARSWPSAFPCRGGAAISRPGAFSLPFLLLSLQLGAEGSGGVQVPRRELGGRGSKTRTGPAGGAAWKPWDGGRGALATILLVLG